MNKIRNKVKRIILFIVAVLSFTFASQQKAQAQFYSLYGNALLLPTGTLNVGMDIGITPKLIFDFAIMGNPFAFKAFQTQFIQIQPGLRIWFEEMQYSQFLGVHLFAGFFDFGNREFHNTGFAAGLGLSWGYQWYITKRINLGVEFGLGVGYVDSSRQNHYEDIFNDFYINRHAQLAVLPTKLGVNVVYIF